METGQASKQANRQADRLAGKQEEIMMESYKLITMLWFNIYCEQIVRYNETKYLATTATTTEK